MALRNKDVMEGMYVTSRKGRDTWKVIYWNGSYTDVLLRYIDDNGNKSDSYVITEGYILEGDYENPEISWVNGSYFDADFERDAVNEFLAWSRGKPTKKSAKKPMNKLREGAGAGYTVEIDGIEPNFSKISLNKKDDEVLFDIPIKKGIADYWKAEDYYEGVDSEGIYYDNELVMEYGKSDREIKGGVLHGSLNLQDILDYSRISDAEDISGITDDEIIEFIEMELGNSIDIETMFGGGWLHVSLDPKGFMLESSRYSDLVKDSESLVSIDSADIIAPNMAEDINWYFKNSFNFEEIFFGEEE